MSQYQSYPSSSYAPQQHQQGGGAGYGNSSYPSYSGMAPQQQGSYSSGHRQQPNGGGGHGGEYASEPQGMVMPQAQPYQAPSQTYHIPPTKEDSWHAGHGMRESTGEKRMWQEEARTWGWGEFLRSFCTRNQIAFLTLLLTQAIVILVMICIVFARIQHNILKTDPQLQSVSTYLTIFIFAEIFEMVAALDALRLKNTIQLIFIVLFNLAIMLYGTLVPSQLKQALQPHTPGDCSKPTDPDGTDPDLTCFGVLNLYEDIKGFLLVIPIVAGVFSIFCAYLSWRLYAEFGWDVYKKIGASLTLKSMYLQYQVYVCFLKFDFFFIVGTVVQYLILVLNGAKETEFGVTLAALPVSCVLLVVAAVTVRLEIRWAMWLMFVGELLGLTYMIYKLYRLFEPTQSYRYHVSERTMTVFTVLSILMLAGTTACSVLCYMNFGNGLREHIPPYFPSLGRKRESVQRPAIDDHRVASSAPAPSSDAPRPSGPRMTLD